MTSKALKLSTSCTALTDLTAGDEILAGGRCGVAGLDHCVDHAHAGAAATAATAAAEVCRADGHKGASIASDAVSGVEK